MKSFAAVLLLGLLAASPAAGQNYQQLRQAILEQQKQTRSEIDRIDELINQYERRLNQARQKYDEIYKQYENLNRLLALREQKIASLEKEQRQISEEIDVTEQKLRQQQQKLDDLIADYKQTMRYLYKNGRTSQLALILSSASVNQMMVRNYYLKKFETYREEQAAEIRHTQQDLRESRAQLDQAADRNTELLAEIQTEKEKLQERQAQQSTNVKLLRQDRQNIQQDLAEMRQQKEEFNNTLSQLISREEELREAERQRQVELAAAENAANANTDAGAGAPAEGTAPEERPAESGGSSASGTNFVGEVGFVSDAEFEAMESAFASAKGQLPWPVSSSTISEHFGRQRHPVYGTVTENLGIEIVTPPRAEVRVVHDGQVFAVQPMAGYGDVVFVKHGRFITAYGNLSRVLVRKNTILEKGDLLGYAGEQSSALGESVFFMLRAGNRNVDPESWLRNK